MNLRIPGPTPVPPEVLQAMAKQMINHRGPEFAEIIGDITARLKRLFQTENDLYILTSSGTGAMEAAVVNFFSPGDRVLVASIGAFGDRFAAIAKAFGAEVEKLDFPWDSAVDPDIVEARLKADPSIKGVMVTHNETSTGVTNDLPAIAAAIRKHDRLVVVDAISSVGAIDLRTDEWGCDVVVTCSQKSWMAPPGLAMISVSPRAWEAHANAKMPRYYWDISAAKRYLDIGQTPWTPAVSVFYALQVSLAHIEEQGLANILRHHEELGRYTREGLKAMGLELFVKDERCASNVVTAVKNPEGMDLKAFLRKLRVEHGVVLAAGQAKLSSSIFRIAHLGYVSKEDIDDALSAIRIVLPQVGFSLPKARV
ncbi:MAG: alanine--glyoxylate aminotransferase family protein [Bacteroidetes bacterium]|nr:alanine--glyoxylate aminotransferase family protein [Bacteroidota bacterium]MCL5026537.1 alanine--glyoxylate aminotransferase family protein [Chloroflexota bacterium]